MYYYEVVILRSRVKNLSYSFHIELKPFSQVTVPLRGKEVKGYVIKLITKPKFEVLDIISFNGNYLTKLQQDMAKFISSYYCSTINESLSMFFPTKNIDSAVEPNQYSVGITLTNNQNDALKFIKSEKISLLFADTASGKTEIYMSYIKDIINHGNTVLLLMPEISLTPQIESRVKKYFYDSVVVWHSKLTKKQREITLDKVIDGSAKVILGARSALFLPLNNVGLIIVDEEHDNSYKSNNKPRYNGRDLAIYLSTLFKCNIVLGSATPSLNSYVKFNHYRLKGSFANSNKSYQFINSYENHLVKNLLQVKKEGGQSLVFVPTKANFKLLKCNNCGHIKSCPFCSVSLSLYLKKRALICNYCGYTQKIEDTCSECGGLYTLSKVGTAEIANYIATNSNLKVELFDRENITTLKQLKKSLNDFNGGKIDVLVGTQMLSKGHNYDNIKLSVIIGIDNVLNRPTFSAREDALSLFLQVAGRSGRNSDSKVITYGNNSEFFNEYKNDYEGFLKDEIVFRKGLFPPFTKLMRLIIAHKNEKEAKKMMELCISELNLEKVSIIKSGEASIFKISNRFRYEILLRGDNSIDLINSASRLSLYDSSYLTIDNDPLEFS